MIEKWGWYPEHLGPTFITILTEFINFRVTAKRGIKAAEAAGDAAQIEVLNTASSSVKIVINGTFGKLGDRYSLIFAPELLIQTTVTGQFSLLLIIAMFAKINMQVISANTDGVLIRCPKSRRADLDAVVSEWEQTCSLRMEKTEYKSIHFMNVNNYIAVETNGKCKSKGIFAEKRIGAKFGFVKKPRLR
jgi:DNA polymerase elongation subunit (family B)